MNLVGAREANNTSPRRLAARVGDLVGNARLYVGIVALVLYGITLLSYERFYEILRIDPDEVGLTQVGIVTRALLTLVVFAFSCLIAAAVIYVASFITLVVRSGGIRAAVSDNHWGNRWGTTQPELVRQGLLSLGVLLLACD